jgi:hypothetical protein
MHAVGVAQETAVSRSSGGGEAGSTVGVVAQLVPFHDSANVVVLSTVVVEPTATHADAEVHATPASCSDGPVQPVPQPVAVVPPLAC